ncbi:siderophore-iron reductase FhuF [Pseudomonas typographi]|uniref:siderophore-iron reductase FhuF n=1 Tax=Pseudomonas typographi TaxID=2715964 RepID=UPI00168542BF|nr:siderophore-iron reductase FhuF [Pseudomonas typographi]MBD1555142.1 siderophore-iron reductase FhuF [Pseudomonas typographi]
MIDVLAPLFRGDFEAYRDVLVLADDPRPAASYDTLLAPRAFGDLQGRFGQRYSGDDRRALVSLWAKHYIVKLLPPVMGATLLLRWRLPLSLADTALVLDEGLLPQAFRLVGKGEPFAADVSDPFELFSGLLDDHLQPLFQAMASQVKLSPKVLWSNAGNYFENLLNLMAKAGMPAERLAPGRSLLETKARPDGTRNPLFQPVQYLPITDEHGQPTLRRERKVCCVRYLLPELELCGNCPLKVKPGKLACA